MSGDVFDLSAARAARREQEKAPFVFAWDGVQHEVPASRDWPVDAVSAMSSGQIDVALRLILTDEVFDSMEGMTVGDVETLFNAISAHEGLSAGNSSPRASRATRPKSKR